MNDKKPEKRGLGRGLSALDGGCEPRSGRPQRHHIVVRTQWFRLSACSLIRTSPAAIFLLKGCRILPHPSAQGRSFSHLSSAKRGMVNIRLLPASAAGAPRRSPNCMKSPCWFETFSDEEVLEIAIVENIQRADLNAIEEALAYRQLMDRFGHTQEKMAEALGEKPKPHRQHACVFCNCQKRFKTYVREGKLTPGHARALITTPNAPNSRGRSSLKG